MANTIFEQTGGTYTRVGDYMLPDLLPAEEEKEARPAAEVIGENGLLRYTGS